MDILKIKMPNISFNGRRLRRAINLDVGHLSEEL